MRGEIGKTFNRLLTAFMLVAVLIACEKMPEDETVETQPNKVILDNYQ